MALENVTFQINLLHFIVMCDYVLLKCIFMWVCVCRYMYIVGTCDWCWVSFSITIQPDRLTNELHWSTNLLGLPFTTCWGSRHVIHQPSWGCYKGKLTYSCLIWQELYWLSYILGHIIHSVLLFSGFALSWALNKCLPMDSDLSSPQYHPLNNIPSIFTAVTNFKFSSILIWTNL